MSAVANVAASPVSPTTRVCAAWASSSNCSRSSGDGRLRRAFERDPLGGLAGDLPVHRTVGLQQPHHLREVDLREVDLGEVEVAAAGTAAEQEGRKARNGRVGRVRRAVGEGIFGFFGVSRLRRVGHAVSVWGCIPSRSPAHPASSAVICCRCTAHPDVERVLGLDVREPERRPRNVEFARVDIAGTELKPLLEGIDVVVHLAGVVDPVPDEALMARVNVEGTRHVLDAAASVGVRRIVRVSSATVYGAWPNNPVPLTEAAPLRPNPHFSPAVQGAEVERLIAEWRDEHPGVTVTTLRSAPVVGPGAERLPARILLGRPPLRVRGAAMPVQVVHVDDLAAALALAATRDLPGVYNVAADGWLDAAAAATLAPAFVLPADARRRWSGAARERGTSGSATSRPASCPTSPTRG